MLKRFSGHLVCLVDTKARHIRYCSGKAFFLFDDKNLLVSRLIDLLIDRKIAAILIMNYAFLMIVN